MGGVYFMGGAVTEIEKIIDELVNEITLHQFLNRKEEMKILLGNFAKEIKRAAIEGDFA